MLIRKWPAVLAAVLFSAAPGLAQRPGQPLPADPQVKIGHLPNGLTYYIRHNAEPKNRAQLLLVNKVGSVQETDAEQGLAHFTEHMAFNGTKDFPKNELVDFLQSNGIRFGDDLNASTTAERTIFLLPVPTDSARVFRRAFDILQDWAHEVTMDPAEIDKERGVIIEELRSGRGAQQRLKAQYMAPLLNNSRWGHRDVVGDEQFLRTFRPEVLRRFYQKWYQPQNEAIIAVGDFDVATVERLIKQKFGAIPTDLHPQPLGKFPIATNADTKVIIVTDREQANTQLELLTRLPKLRGTTYGELREALRRNLFNQLMAGRLQELGQQADAPFQRGFSVVGGYLGNYDSFTTGVVVKPGEVERGFRAVLDATARAARFGFTAPELARARQGIEAQLQQILATKNQTTSEALATEYANLFVSGGVSLSPEQYVQAIRQALPGLGLAEVNALAKTLVGTTQNRALLVTAPAADRASLPTEAQLLRWVAEAGQHATAYVEATAGQGILASPPTPGPVLHEKYLADIGVTELTLANGLRVVLKPTDFKSNEVQFRGYSFGGTSLYPAAERLTAAQSNVLAAQGGVGALTNAELSRYLTGKTVSASTYVDELTEGINGAFAPQDAETALQIIHAKFSAPRKDAARMASYLKSLKAGLEQQAASPDPQQVYGDTIRALLSGYSPLRRPVQPADVAGIDADKALADYQERFGNAADFTFLFVGDFTVAQLRPLLEKYLGSLPGNQPREQFRDLHIAPVPGRVTRTVYQGVGDKGSAQFIYSGSLPYTPENLVNLSALEEVIRIRLTEEIREKESGVYTVSVQANAEKLPTPNYLLSIGYGADPKRLAELAAKTLPLLESLRQTGPAPRDVEKFKVETKRQLELQLRSNAYWTGALLTSYLYDQDPRTILQAQARVEAVTAASVKEMATKVIGPNLVQVFLLSARP